MELFDKIDDILEQENMVLPKGASKVKTEFTFDEKLFNKMANFIINLDPEKLTDTQLEGVIKMIDEIEIESGDLSEGARLAQKSTLSKNQYSKKWYSKNKSEVKRRKERFKRSSEGRKKKNGKTKLQYNRRIRSKRNENHR